jgi:hypothetical protein
MAENDTPDTPLHVLIPVNLKERMEQMAKEEDRSLAAEVRRALAAHLLKGAVPR